MTRWKLVVGCVLAAAVAAVTIAGAGATHKAGTFTVFWFGGINTPVNNYPGVPDALNVAAADINAHGGIGGKTLAIETCNTQATAVGQAACARQAVSDHVDAVISDGQFTTSSNPILDAAHIPQIGGLVTNPTDYDDPNVLSPLGGGSLAFASIPFVAARHGAKSISVMIFDTQTSYYLNGIIRTASKPAHVKYVGGVIIPTTVTDYTAYVQQLKNQGAAAVGMILPPTGGLSTLRVEGQLGLNITNVAFTTSWADTDLANFGGLETNPGVFACSELPPVSAASQFPAVKKFADAMTAAGHQDQGFISMAGWMDLYAIQDLAKLVKGDVNGQSILAAGRKAKNVNVLGLFNWNPGVKGPGAFANGSNGDCWFVKGSGGKWVLDGSTKPFDVWKAMGIGK